MFLRLIVLITIIVYFQVVYFFFYLNVYILFYLWTQTLLILSVPPTNFD